MAGEDYNNIFSPDYWTQEGYQRRKSGQRQPVPGQGMMEQEQQANSAKSFLDFLAEGVSQAINPSALNGINKPFSLFGVGQSNGSADTKRPFRWPAGELSTQPQNGTDQMDPMTQQSDPLDELRDLLGRKYDGGSPVDNSFLQTNLDARLAPIGAAEQQAQSNFKTSDANLQAMHDAFKNEILGQAPQLQEQNKQFQNNLTGIFDKTIQEGQQRKAANDAQKAEMLQRLGIAPAANQPDLVSQAIEQGNQNAQGSRDTRLAEAANMGQSALARNTASATAVGNDALQRRSDLSRRLQDILGSLGSKRADISAQFQQQKAQAGQEAERRKYDEFIRERDWNRQRYQDEIGNRAKMQQSGMNSVDSLNNATDPNVVGAVSDALTNEPNIDIRFPNQVMQAIKRRHPNATQEEMAAAFDYITKYNRMATNKSYNSNGVRLL